ncbi:uncharacterized protein LOC110829811 isoform X2 [Zootermopsis nevadensis]|uniref:uncharacterized protein LOC110829811 isoform X2 n=1 Tax=Zootermopsis nevadensis TaxID=136037 RepID=UPI000B8E2A79|nr:uncharacterized protein LOC110829811 isoform X2 [Zootermopsis nevadensis]
MCQCGMSPPVGGLEPQFLPDKRPDSGGTDMRSLQYSRLREELTMEGEQLLSDLSYMQHLYQGSDWQDDTTPPEESLVDWSIEQEELDGDRKLCCLSPTEDSTQEMMMYGEDTGCPQSLPVSQSSVKKTKSVDFRTSSPAIAFPRLALLSKELEEEWKQIERPFNAKAVQKDRKRFWVDSSCLKGIACPFLHGSAQALRPVTL